MPQSWCLTFVFAWSYITALTVEALSRDYLNLCARSTSPIVQAAWARGQELAVHGLIYRPGEGLLKVWLAQIRKHRHCFVRC